MRKSIGISPNTLTKMNKDEEVALTVLGKICNELDCDFGEVVSYLPNEDDLENLD